MINYGMKEQIIDILPSVSLSIIIGIFIWILDKFMLNYLNTINLVRILIGGLSYFASYLTVSHVVKMSPLADFKTLVLKR